MAASYLDSWVNRLKASAREEIQETARGALLYAVAAVSALIAVVFLTLAAFWWLASELGMMPAALVVASFYAIVAVALLMWASLSSRPGTYEQIPEHATAQSSEAASPDMSEVLDLDSVARALAGAGFRTESLVVSATNELARYLTPLQFVGLVFVASFFLGRRIRRR